MSTRDFFVLKSKGNEELLDLFTKSQDVDGKRKLLADVAKKPLPNPVDFPTTPTAIDSVEWFFSTKELCKVIDEVKHLQVVKINAGLAKKEEWDDFAFKGGSEPGVINMTTWVRKGKFSFCVSATWNSGKATEDTPFFLAYSTLLGHLRSRIN